ncbi:hypothetical protein QBC46DRAFT_381011 [Diplogelasinospora grovesii]|uniref:Uncharacterized protein n=1 Tax=Diplogelasinospora grovesii TaxID=303347 RepID=A0AAN6S6B9_9PEZI|nr:hypothetical protein QBC46DRAFT_381011 [Diplogelasinospora grovesii]
MGKKRQRDDAEGAAEGTVQGRAKTESKRTHAENQERAYIAASRRSDRSIEARVQSANMASSIHKKRTGRGLRITAEIVAKEEMYEEEEDPVPSRFRASSTALMTGNAAFNYRANASITVHMAMASAAHEREQEVNAAFASAFGNPASLARRMGNPGCYPPLMGTPQGPNTVPVAAGQQAIHQHAGMPPQSPGYAGMYRRGTRPVSPGIPSHYQQPLSRPVNPASVNPASDPLYSPSPAPPPAYSPPAYSPLAYSPIVPVDPTLSTATLAPPPSSFTSELPSEVRRMAALSLNDPMTSAYLGGNPRDLANNTNAQHRCNKPLPSVERPPQDQLFTFSSLSTYDPSFTFEMGLGQQVQGGSRIGTPGGGPGGESWDAFLDQDLIQEWDNSQELDGSSQQWTCSPYIS